MNKIISVIAIVMVGIYSSLVGSVACAQTFSLQEAVKMAQDSALTLYMAKHQEECTQAAYDKILALRKPQLNLQVNEYNYFSKQNYDRLYVTNDDYKMLSLDGGLELSQKVTKFGGEVFARTKLWNTYNFGSDATDNGMHRYMGAYVPISFGYHNDLLGYNAHAWELRIQEARLEYAQKAYNYELFAIAEKTAELYMRLVVARNSYNTFCHEYVVADSLYNIGMERYRIADVTKANILSLKVNRSNIQNSMNSYGAEVETARTELASYLHCDESLLEDVMSPTPLEQRHVNIAETLQKCLGNSSLLAQYQHQLIEAKAAHDKTVRESKLNANVDFSVGYQIVNVTTPVHSAGFVGGITMNVPLIDHGANKKRRLESELKIATYQDQIAECKRQLECDVRSSIISFESNQQQLENDKKALEEATELIKLSQVGYRLGEVNIDIYTISQQRYDEAFLRYIGKLSDYWTSYYHLAALIQEMP